MRLSRTARSKRSSARIHRRRRSVALLVGLLFASGLVLVAIGVLSGSGRGSSALAQPGEGAVTPQTDASVPARDVTMLGASPGEAPAETWGLGQVEGNSVLVRYRAGEGWTLGAGLLDHEGSPLGGFTLDQPSGFAAPSPLAGQIAPDGAGAMLGSIPSPEGGTAPRQQVLLVRNPGGPFQQTATALKEGEGAVLHANEKLFGSSGSPLLAAVEEPGGAAGAFVVPVGEANQEAVLHWDGTSWTRESIRVPALSSEDFTVIAIGGSSPSNLWLLAKLSSNYPVGSVALFRRTPGEGAQAPSWRPVALSSGAIDEEAHPLTAGAQPFTVPSSLQSQILTVTSEGVWIDGQRSDVNAPTTLFFKASGGLTNWCRLPAGVPEGTPACEHPLPEVLPTGPSRSSAWSNPSTPFGDRVISGLANGVSLRLVGSEFERVLALGGSSAPRDVGGTYGSAFSSPGEGWLGQELLPVHLTENPAPTRLSPWPVAFRHALLAVAPQPNAAVGALPSQALAVGDLGEVARYEPGEGWMPESLLNAGGRLQTPRLRAVAWPTASRAYAVGDRGQMWLWRGETGLWEPDPATPVNFRGNLLGVAFDPTNPARGYAVGESGVLLSYGKSWTQETLPAQVQGASFTSIAFSGAEAIVAYRKLLNPLSSSSYVGGLLTNNGSGWQVDQNAAAAMGSNIPWAVAGLPEGGAAFVAAGAGTGAHVFERESSTWQETGTPYPGGVEPGSLALFRESGQLRVVAAGTVPDTFSVESVPASPPGFPPQFIQPYPLGEGDEGGVERQTASGWNDEEHELNDVREPPGKYVTYDTVYQPDPIASVLVSPSGAQGWAVGGFVNSENGVLDTADVDRYPADGSSPPGIGSSAVPTSAAEATFAIGGGAQCAAPCADRQNARPGADVWLSNALGRAAQVSGVRAFLYTGPRLSAGETTGSAPEFPFSRELERYASILGTSPLPVYAAASPSDLDGRPLGSGSESTFEQTIGLHLPFGGAPPAGTSIAPACEAGCQPTYYAFDSTGAGGKVRVIVLDDTRDVGQGQREWLQAELGKAAALGLPAIVAGNADLATQIAAGDSEAAAVGAILAGESAEASAYFYDAPEQNVQKTLRVGSVVIPTFGSGTLGYVDFHKETSGAFLGASGFLLGQVNVAARNPRTNKAPVTARLIPNIGELGMEAVDGTLLRRSQAALFDALARRPRAGNRSHAGAVMPDTDPYIPIPSNCVGTACANAILPEYSFSSSRPDLGNFVAPNLAAANDARAVLLENEKPIPDPQSGLFCAYNAGTTIVTISAGGLSSSLPVTIQAGSVRRPCGTTPLSVRPSQESAAAPVPPPAPAPAPAPAGPAPAPATAPPPVPAPPPLAPAPPAASHPVPPAKPFFIPAALPAALLPFVPLPVPTPARPTPPSGTSPITSPVEAAEREEEREEAPESASVKALAYHPTDYEPAPAFILGAILLAAFAGASTRRRVRRGRREVKVAPATISAMRSQRRYGRRW